MDQQNIIINIDGSLYEGGGQIFRMSLALSILLDKELKVIKIRSSRPNPGLNQQLIGVIRLFEELGLGQFQGVNMGSQEISFKPIKNELKSQIECKSNSASSVTLMLQCLLPVLIYSKSPINLILRGGTTVSKSPPSDSIINLLIPILKQMNIKLLFEVMQDGYYPVGKGKVKVFINPLDGYISPIQFLNKKPIQDIYINFFLTKQGGVKENLKQIIKSINKFQKINQEEEEKIQQDQKTKFDVTQVKCKKFREAYGIVAQAYNSENFYDFSIMSSVDQSLESLTDEVCKKIEEELNYESCLDEFHQDQLLIYMSLAKGSSSIKVGEKITDHTHGAIYVLKQFIPDISIEILPIKNGNLIQIQGIALGNRLNTENLLQNK